MFGWFRADAARASRRNRSKACGSCETSSGRNLRATSDQARCPRPCKPQARFEACPGKRLTRVASGLLCVHAIAITPAGWMELVRSFLPSTAAFPVKKSGRPLQLFFRGQLSVHSCYGLHARRVAKRPSTPKAPTASLPPLRLRLLPGGANQFPGGTCTR
jgi:hypothetical protein